MIRPVILSGGAGTRLWPLSTSGKPKQFHRLMGEESLLQATAERCRGTGFLRPLVATGEEQRFLVLDQLRRIGIAPEAILLEPASRNTAPAIAAAAYWALARDEDEPMLVMPSDHLVGDLRAFRQAVEVAVDAANSGKLLTFGVKPTAPKTGYGYIEAGKRSGGVRQVRRFVEKPSAEVAAQLAADESYYWNSGIFLFRPSAYWRELEKHAPAVAEHTAAAMQTSTAEGLFVRPEIGAFSKSPNISIDYAVMEHSDEILVVPTLFDWSDIGTWDAVHEMFLADERGNVINGDVVAMDVTNSLIRNEADVTVGAIGLDRIVCVVTRDAAFIAPLNRAQEVKQLVDELQSRSDKHRHKDARLSGPWGSCQIIDQGAGYQTRHIILNPGAKLSPQKLQHRSKHWIVVNGSAEVTLGNEAIVVGESQSTFIPAGTAYGLANRWEVPLHLIEVQCGLHLGDDDIIPTEGN
ncbi:mannose-1-phosphate guanylyltransferase/mannose-6-phosphate isomerase [Sphingomonas limnosediminicola]|uniref:mannose-1-phosphate guanylyltransferase n=1 Tax=Sphingomonas limnosediminicola TaxID=940133 RepID=A0ABP7L4T7_9SPHN